jgi:hypothetical protein
VVHEYPQDDQRSIEQQVEDLSADSIATLHALASELVIPAHAESDDWQSESE